MLEALQIMKWPFVACTLLPGLLIYLGLHIIRREVIFVDLALAQVSALGICVCVMLGHETHELHTYFWSAGFTLVGAMVLALTRGSKTHHVPQEALIGIVYVVAAALGILMLSRSAEGNEELRRTLVGDVLLVRPIDIGKTVLLYLVVAGVHYLWRERFLALSFGPDKAVGLSTRWWDFVFYGLFGLAVTSFVQMGGVLLTFSYLIVPAVCANFLADSMLLRLLIGWVIATISSVAGLAVSYKGDFPTGATIVCALGLALVLVAAGRHLRNRSAAAGSPGRDQSPPVST
jgi:zinc/manganese transport system permease protein